MAQKSSTKTLSEPQTSPHQLHFYFRYKCIEALSEIEFSVANLKAYRSSKNIRQYERATSGCRRMVQVLGNPVAVRRW